MEACPAPQTSAAFHSEFVRTLVDERVTVVDRKAEAGPSTALRFAQDDTSLEGLREMEMRGFFAPPGRATEDRVTKIFKRRSDLMVQGCVSSRLRYRMAAAAALQVTHR